MNPQTGYRISSAAFALLAISVLPLSIMAQHGAHTAAPTHMSAPASRMAAPRAPAHAPMTMAPRVQQVPRAVAGPVTGRPMPPRVFIPSAPGGNVANAGLPVSETAIIRNSTIGFPRGRISIGPRAGLTPPAPRGTVFGDGRTFWADGAGGHIASGPVAQSNVRRWRGPLPRRPIFYPIFYPSFYPGIGGFGWNAGFGTCDPFWGWNSGCGYGYGYGDYLLGGYEGPSEPYYEPVPSDNNSSNEQDGAVVYLKDGTVYLISNYWMANDQLHYVMSDGVEHVIDMDEVDLQRTVDANEKRGVDFTLRATPATAAVNGQNSGTPQK
jgi:hypothetical protein